MERKRKLLPGQQVPFLEAYDREGKVIRTQDLKSAYILLWFWEPDCETCMELTPALLDFYSQFKHSLDLKSMRLP
jgi:thiol-disulfide isomerase/thioredoxin